MLKVLFVCLGNICRSPMAEFIFKDLVRKDELEKFILAKSVGTTYETIGQDMYEEAKRKLDEKKYLIRDAEQEELIKVII